MPSRSSQAEHIDVRTGVSRLSRSWPQAEVITARQVIELMYTGYNSTKR
jgi:hypothetical protein